MSALFNEMPPSAVGRKVTEILKISARGPTFLEHPAQLKKDTNNGEPIPEVQGQRYVIVHTSLTLEVAPEQPRENFDINGAPRTH